MQTTTMQPGINRMAETFRLLGDSTRLTVIHALLPGGERNVGDLANEMGCSQANMSKHLKQLARAGVLARRKEGLQVYYCLSDPLIARVWQLVYPNISGNGRAKNRSRTTSPRRFRSSTRTTRPGECPKPDQAA